MREGAGPCPHRDQVPALVNGQLPERETARWRAHAERCTICRAEEARYRRVIDTLRELPPLAAPLGLRERILDQASQAGTRAAGDDGRRQREPGRRDLRRLPFLYRLTAVIVLMLGIWIARAYFGGRYQGRTPEQWLLAARQTAESSYSLHVVGWVKTPRGIVPVEGWRVANRLKLRIGDRAAVIQGSAGAPRLLFATWSGAAGRFDYGAPLLFLNGPEPRPAGPARFQSRAPLVIAVPRQAGLAERVRIDPVSQQVLRAQLVGADGRPVAALERLEYNLPAVLSPLGQGLN